MIIDPEQINSNSYINFKWGKELLSQKGGWTAGEMCIDINLADCVLYRIEDRQPRVVRSQTFEDVMAEGYLSMADEHIKFAQDCVSIAKEILPEWE